MTTQNFIDMYGLLLGENAGPVKKMMMVHAAYWALKCGMGNIHLLAHYSFLDEEIASALKILEKEQEKTF